MILLEFVFHDFIVNPKIPRAHVDQNNVDQNGGVVHVPLDPHEHVCVNYFSLMIDQFIIISSCSTNFLGPISSERRNT